MASAGVSEVLARIGNVPRLSEPAHARRARFHQAWYRAERLGVEGWGATAAGRPLGSILPQYAAAAGRNFTSEVSEQLFQDRRKRGWGVDPVRMTSHMTSSQALLVNMLGPLLARPSWWLGILAQLLNRSDLRSLDGWEVEFAPAARSQYLADMTRVDAFFVIQTDAGPEAFVLELKYTDRFSTRKVDVASNGRYYELAESTGLWNDPVRAFGENTTGQLLRCHALGARALEVDHSGKRTTLLLISHPTDQGADLVFKSYQNQLARPETSVHVTLDIVLGAALEAAECQAEIVHMQELQIRYLMHDLSAVAWREHVK